MCVVSMIYDYYHQPQRYQTVWPVVQNDPALAAQLLEVIKRLEAIDKRLGDIECKVERKKKAALKRDLKRIAGSASDVK